MAELSEIVEKLKQNDRPPQRLILTSLNIEGSLLRQIADDAGTLGLGLARMPRVTELRAETGAAELGDKLQIRPVAIEDLLGRPQRVLDRDAMARLIEGRRVLVTGAGGTIGSELVRQIAAAGPVHLTLVDNGEFQLYGIDLDLAEQFPRLPRSAKLGDVRDRTRLEEILAEARPELVFHAAAYKHVPMVENNPTEGVLTNVIGTRNLAEACRTAGVDAMAAKKTQIFKGQVDVTEVAPRRCCADKVQKLSLSFRSMLSKKKKKIKKKIKTEIAIETETKTKVSDLTLAPSEVGQRARRRRMRRSQVMSIPPHILRSRVFSPLT